MERVMMRLDGKWLKAMLAQRRNACRHGDRADRMIREWYENTLPEKLQTGGDASTWAARQNGASNVPAPQIHRPILPQRPRYPGTLTGVR